MVRLFTAISSLRIFSSVRLESSNFVTSALLALWTHLRLISIPTMFPQDGTGRQNFLLAMQLTLEQSMCGQLAAYLLKFSMACLYFQATLICIHCSWFLRQWPQTILNMKERSKSYQRSSELHSAWIPSLKDTRYRWLLSPLKAQRLSMKSLSNLFWKTLMKLN